MSVESPGAFNSTQTYGAEQSRRAWFGWLPRDASADVGSVTGGIRATGDLALTAPVSGMSVNVGVGECFVAGSSSTLQGGYYGRVSSTTNLAVAAANASNPRVDLVSAVITDSAYAGVTNTFSVAVTTGTPTAGATLVNLNGAPAAPASSLTLGYVLVPANSTNVTNGNISTVVAVIGLGTGSDIPGFRLVTSISAVVQGGTGVGNWLVNPAGALVATSGNTISGNALAGLIRLDLSDWQITGRTGPQLTLKFAALGNATAAAQTISAALYPVSAVAGASGNLIVTLGAATASAGVSPSASAGSTAETTFAFPSNGYYVLGVSVGGSTAAASDVAVSGQLWANI